MPLTEPRLSDPFKIVYLKDSALDEVPAEIMEDYENTREFSVLEEPNIELDWGGLATLREQPTIFTVAPLHPDDDHLAFSPGADNYKRIVQRHIISVENSGIPARSFKTGHGRTMMDFEVFEKWLPTEWVYDLAIPIVKRGQEVETALFGRRGIWRQDRILRKLRRLASTEDAVGESPVTKTDSA